MECCGELGVLRRLGVLRNRSDGVLPPPGLIWKILLALGADHGFGC